jgi:hypothetical protein
MKPIRRPAAAVAVAITAMAGASTRIGSGFPARTGADAVYLVDDFGSDNNLQLFH